MKSAFYSAVVPIVGACLLASVASADDTEIFYSKELGENEKAVNILFMFDTSGSMGWTDAAQGIHTTRMDRLKKAMTDVLASTENVSIGMGTFNGALSGGAIKHSPIGVDDDLCSDNTCDAINLSSRIAANEDDASESADGSVSLYENSLYMTPPAGGGNAYNFWSELAGGNNDAEQLNNGQLVTNGQTVNMFGGYPNPPYKSGFRFTDLAVDRGSIISNAQITMMGKLGSNNGSQAGVIKLDATSDSPAFADSPGQRIADRATIDVTTDWPVLPHVNYDNTPLVTPDLSAMIQARIAQDDWDKFDALTFIFEIAPGMSPSGNQRLIKTSENSGQSPVLTFEAAGVVNQESTVGLRFSDLNIPRGATISSASLDLNPTVSGTMATPVTIAAQLIGNAPAFSGENKHLSNRIKTTNSIDWTPGPWTVNQKKTTVDLTSIVQEVSNRADWCGGNAFAFLLTGTNMHQIVARDSDVFKAAQLNITYDPSTVENASTCVNGKIASKVDSGIDDVLQLANGNVLTNKKKLDTRTGNNNNVLGLRFTGVEVPQGAVVTSAYLRMISGGPVPSAGANADVHITISAENTAYSEAFNASAENDVSTRPRTSASALWRDVPIEPDGNGMTSADFGAVVGEVITRLDWVSGNALTLFLAPEVGSTGTRSFGSYDDSTAAQITINYQLEGDELMNTDIQVLSGRDVLNDSMLELNAFGGTPIVDSYYEAAAYLSGNAVVYGRTRGDGVNAWERTMRLSAPETYSGGILQRPPGCTEADLDALACVGETITGNPVYIAPEPGVCQANQIILLSDGAATANTATAVIPALTGKTCAFRTNSAEMCGIELAQWLHESDHFAAITGQQPVITHTVGFSFSSPFLRQLAEAGGGQYYTANTSADLVSVFSNIIETASNPNTSFVPPSATISQGNRLTNSNDLYFGQFKPAATAKWDGNLKKYKIAKVDGKPAVVDAENDPVFDAITGEIVVTAKSIWSDVIDGADVTKGGAASKLALQRKIYTNLSSQSNALALSEFSESNAGITNEILKIDPLWTDYRSNLLKWARGVDMKDVDGDGDTLEVRQQMGDPMHSSPAVVRYENESVAFVGTNEGFLHAFSTETGLEKFAFIPYELLGNLNAFYKNGGTTQRTYGLDGHITTWIDDKNNNAIADDGEDVLLIIGMRRGGKNYYALNITDLENPVLQWVISGDDDNFSELGQTWSKAVKTKLKVSGTVKDVLIFTAGYDPRNDTKLQRSASDTIGRGFYIVDAKTGERLAYKTPTDFSSLMYSIPSTPRVIDINVDGLADFMFVGDTGAQIWRFDFDNSTTNSLNNSISGAVIADFGGVNVSENRKFFYEPDVALIKDEYGKEFLSIAIGTGWRSHPLDTVVNDRFYILRDKNVYHAPMNTNGTVSYAGLKVRESDIFDASEYSTTTDTTKKSEKGWYITLDSVGEKVLSSATTLYGKVLFTSYLPESGLADACSAALGGGRIYALDMMTGQAASNLDPSGDDSVLTLTDRSANLQTPGIPPSVSSLLPEASPNELVVIVGAEVVPPMDFGPLFKRTFWAEQ